MLACAFDGLRDKTQHAGIQGVKLRGEPLLLRQLDLKEFWDYNPLLAIYIKQVFSTLQCHGPRGFQNE